MVLRNLTCDAIRELFTKLGVPNIDDALRHLETKVREEGSTTGNLEEYCFEVMVEITPRGTAAVRNVKIIPDSYRKDGIRIRQPL